MAMSRQERKRGIRVGLKDEKRNTGNDTGEPKRDKYGNLPYHEDPLVRGLEAVVNLASLGWYALVLYTFLQIFVW